MGESVVNLKQWRATALAQSHGLRHQLHHGLELLTDDHELCQWDGPLLPLEKIDVVIKHGTNNGYQTHLRHRIPVCGDCADAHREARRQERAAARKQKVA